MNTLMKQRENSLNMSYSTKNMEINSIHLSNIPDFIENCLKVLENFTLMLLNTSEKLNSVSKLNYCYCYFNTIRWQLENPTSLQRNLLMEIAKSIIKRIQNSIGLLGPPGNYHPISPSESSKPRCILSPITAKYNICKRKNKRKSKSHKSTSNTEHSKKFLNRFCGNLLHPDNKHGSSRKSCSIQHVIDQMYLQIRAVLAENCIDDADILKELSVSMKEGSLSTLGSEAQRLPPINRQVNNAKYQEQLWSGDCKLNDDSRDMFSDQLDSVLALNNLDIDITSLADKIFSSKNKLYFQKHRYRKDSELDEGFSENEYLYDLDSKTDVTDSSEFFSSEKFSHCGDCHYNSSNSKSDEMQVPDHSKDETDAPIESNDDGSDSDGGTELLNSVNDSLNKFNAFMQSSLNTDAQLEEKPSNFTMDDVDKAAVDNVWTMRYQNSSDNRPAENGQINSGQKKAFEKTGLLAHDQNLPVSSSPDSVIYKDDRSESTIPTVSNVQQMLSISNAPNYNYDNVSKLLVPPVNIQNWCSYNLSAVASPCNFSYHTKPNMNVEGNTSIAENYSIGKISSWLPPISHGLISSNSYIIGSNHPQQSFHRILLSPHLTLAQGNMGPMPHNIVHLPQIFHQLPHSMLDIDYFDRCQIPINQQNQYSNPNNNNSSSDYSMSSATNLIANSNCSNVSLSTNLHHSVSIIKSSLDKSQRACCFYMRGGCKKEDCEYAHDLSKVTCKFWEKGDCFKADTCPFKHGFIKV